MIELNDIDIDEWYWCQRFGDKVRCKTLNKNNNYVYISESTGKTAWISPKSFISTAKTPWYALKSINSIFKILGLPATGVLWVQNKLLYDNKTKDYDNIKILAAEVSKNNKTPFHESEYFQMIKGIISAIVSGIVVGVITWINQS